MYQFNVHFVTETQFLIVFFFKFSSKKFYSYLDPRIASEIISQGRQCLVVQASLQLPNHPIKLVTTLIVITKRTIFHTSTRKRVLSCSMLNLGIKGCKTESFLVFL